MFVKIPFYEHPVYKVLLVLLDYFLSFFLDLFIFLYFTYFCENVFRASHV